jgi:hypothetical protein
MRKTRCLWVVVELLYVQACGNSGKPPEQAPAAQGTGTSTSAASGGTGGIGSAGAGGAAHAPGSGGAPAAAGGSGAGASSSEPSARASVAGAGGAGGIGGAAAVSAAGSPAPAAARCAPRKISGTPEMHFHHVHFNTADPEADMAFFDKFFNAKAETFCSDATGKPTTRATRTERGWFLYQKVAMPPDDRMNTYMEHIGWINAMPEPEFQRQRSLGIMFDEEGRAQCPEAASGMAACALPGLGTPYYYYTEVPNGTRVEVALGPGPATSGFGHVHFVMGEDLDFFGKVSDGKNVGANRAIDDVNHINSLLDESILDDETVVDSRDKPLGHLAYSTTELEAARTRIMSMGIAIAEDISMKDEYGFRSFFVRAPKGTWLEIVEDTHFQ